MNIIIHRGINQVGGCITEISTSRARIIIDLGETLPGEGGSQSDCFSSVESVVELTNNIDAIFYTHYHGDHFAYFHQVPRHIPQYIGSVAKKVVLRKYQQLSYGGVCNEDSEARIASIEGMRSFIPQQVIQIENIKITPYFVSHSAYDAYMFLVEADGKRVLHTGDFRGHGYLSKSFLKMVQKQIVDKAKIDILIIEGTLLSRLNQTISHELHLKYEVEKLMSEYKNVFVLCSSTDMERLATFYAANKKMRYRPFVCDGFQKSVLDIFSESAGQKSHFFLFKNLYTFSKGNEKLVSWMKDQGFCMLIRATDKFEDYFEYLLPLLDADQTILIFSMWKEYVNPSSKHLIDRYLACVERFPRMFHVHGSGHASAEFISDVCSVVNPTTGIIPIHSEKSLDIKNVLMSEELKNKVIASSQLIDGINIVC